MCAPGGVIYFQAPAEHLAVIKPSRRAFYPPTVAKKLWRLLNRSFAVQPTMEMHVLPREEVLAIVRAAHGEVLAIEACPKTGGDFVSYAYLVRKP